MNSTQPRQLSEWLVAVKNGKIVKAAFTLTSKVPKGVVHTTHFDEENRDLIIHWYCEKPSKELEANMPLIVSDWLSDGRLG